MILRLFAAFDCPDEDGINDWCVRHELEGGDTEVVAAILRDAAVSVGLPVSKLGTDEDFETRARLAQVMAAGPELLAACEALLEAFPAPKIRAGNGFNGNLAHAAARKAIAKAKGVGP